MTTQFYSRTLLPPHPTHTQVVNLLSIFGNDIKYIPSQGANADCTGPMVVKMVQNVLSL